MKAVQLLVNSVLPEDIRDYTRSYDKKSIEELLNTIADKYPDKYEELSKSLQDIGRESSYIQGETIRLSDFTVDIGKEALFDQMRDEIDAIEDSVVNDKEKQLLKLKTYNQYANVISERTLDSIKNNPNNEIGNFVISGARGKPDQLRGIVSTPAMFTDYKDDPIPLFVKRSYGEGLRPHEYAASVFGARKGILATKNSTQDAGYVGKMAAQASADNIITTKDCGTHNGISLTVDDDSLTGRVLQRSVGGIPAGTLINRTVANELRKNKDTKKVFVRSALTCSAPEGMCSSCHGALPGNKRLPSIGYSAGITAAQSIAEPLAQSALNTKHSGGAFSGDKKTYSGLNYIEQVLQSPESYPEKAAVSEVEGTVTSIEEASQGGTYITIDDTKHYVLPQYQPTVKVGDTVEAGHQISEGLIDVEDIIATRGLGEGRKAFVSTLGQVLSDTGIPAHKRNLETFARSAINHVKIEDLDDSGNYLPDDIVYYNTYSTNYVPSKEAKVFNIDNAVGKYLEEPALHYTIGTKLTPTMAKDITEAGLTNVFASNNKPAFNPIVNRLTAAKHNDPDWLVRMSTSYLKANIGDAAKKGLDTKTIGNTHFAPALAGNVPDFGKNIERTGKF